MNIDEIKDIPFLRSKIVKHLLLFAETYGRKPDNIDFRRVYSKDFNSNVSIKANTLEKLNLNLTEDEKLKINKLIKFNLDDTLSLINNNNKIYDLTNLDEINTYINHYCTQINNIFLSFNHLLLKLVNSYAIDKCISFYDDKDNENIKYNKRLYDEINFYFTVDKDIIVNNSKIKEFNTAIQFLSINNKNIKQNLINNKKIFEENNSFFNISHYIFNEKNNLRILHRQIQKNKKINISAKKIHKNIQTNIKEIELLKKELNSKKELKEKYTRHIYYRLSVLLRKNENLILKYKKYIEVNNSSELLVSLIREKKSFLRGLLNYLHFKDNSFLNDSKHMIMYNQLIQKIKQIKFKSLNIGMEKMYLVNNKTGNNNSIEKLTQYFSNNGIIPDFLVKIFYLYEVLFRNQYSHGWHTFFNFLFGGDYIGNIEIDFDCNEIYKLLKDKETGLSVLSELRSNMKDGSLNYEREIIMRFNMGIEFNFENSKSVLMKDLTLSPELLHKIKVSSNSKYLQDLILFQEKNNINIVSPMELLNLIKTPPKEYCISLNSLIYYIFLFLAFYIKTMKEIEITNPYYEKRLCFEKRKKTALTDNFFNKHFKEF